ncbi:tetratricopeptide repeat protein [Caenimonas aquaedulcis]|uniref:Tetratricopeptide repeat protein n=1 Tax=Caenimonas aquaedulcis TaxID=2793270 RepID=A0A931H8G7_9BURK|nr:tetratricopeptide repeat protein [Caenimonas aquaedulcis]MBG9390278.1 tetratricopeptide repeat protein [Caenimonas aquaedulcis]
MTTNLDPIKNQFREGRHAEAIAACEALCAREPSNRDARRLCATMHALTRNFARSLELLMQIRDPAREDPDILFNIGMCERELNHLDAAQQHFRTYTEKFPASADGWASWAECKFQLGEFTEGIRLADRALGLDASMLPARKVREDCEKALRDPDALKDAVLRLLEAGQGDAALALCRDVLKTQPDNLTAKLGAEWVLSQLVPLWHVPMMNEPERNQAFQDGLATRVTAQTSVFEIGTGSGLLAMMAARLGARRVVTCEAVGLIAGTARKIVARNGYADRITVLAKPSQAVQLGPDLPEKADILVHEVFSSELLGEHVLPAIEDAKARLLKPGGAVLPGAASIMIALVGGDALGRNLHVSESFGFDLGAFNAIHPKKRPLYREDLSPTLLSGDVEVFRFDFQGQALFPAEKKVVEITATQPGLCHGVIQWIRIDMAEGIRFENHPSRRREVSNWQHTIYGFDEPLALQPGEVVAIEAMHDRARPWFSRRP